METKTETAWDAARKELIKKTCCPKEISDVELQHFGDWCARAGLDPLRGDCMLQERRSKAKDKYGNDLVDGQGKPVWERKLTPMATEAGMARRAAEFPDYRGVLGAAVYEGDDIAFDHSTSSIKHTSNPLKRGKVIGAWATVKREGFQFPIEWCRIEGYAQPSPLWNNATGIPDTMISKCARQAAYRRAFPGQLADVYVPEEMGRLDREAGVVVEVATPSTSVKDKVAAHLASLPASTGAEVSGLPAAGLPAAEQPEDAELVPDAAAPAPVAVTTFDKPAASPPPASTSPTALGLLPDLKILFGPEQWKGKLAAALPGGARELLEVINYGNAQLAQAKGNEKWFLKTRGNVADLRALYVKLAPLSAPGLMAVPPPAAAAAAAPASREPGEEG